MRILQITGTLKTGQKPYNEHGLHNGKTGVVYWVSCVLAINLNCLIKTPKEVFVISTNGRNPARSLKVLSLSFETRDKDFSRWSK